MASKKARARKKKSRSRDTNAANGGEAIPGLPNHLVVAHILRSEYFDDPADLARLPAVSRAMRDAVAATGLAFEELDKVDAAQLGCLSAVKRLQRGGRLSRREYLCHAAASERTARRVEGVARGRLAVGLIHVRVGGGRRTSRVAAVSARERLHVGRGIVLESCGGRAPRGAPVGARERLPVGQVDVHCGQRIRVT